MSALATYRQAYECLPEPLRAARAQAWDRFAQLGFPGKRLEEWRYTDLSDLAQATFAPAGGNAPALDALPGWQPLRFVDGQRLDGDAQAPDATLQDDGVTALNAALVRDGLNWRVPRNEQPGAIHLIAWSGAGAMSHLRHRIHIEAGAQATLLLDLRSDDSAALSTAVTEIELGANASLRLLRIQGLGSAATDLSRTEVRVGRDARLEYVGLDVGGALVRHDLNVHLAEPGASADVHGVLAPGGSSHQDTHTRIRHAAPHTTSREIFRGLVRDKAHAVFNGKIVVEKGAQKTDSDQNLASLLLSPGAEINAKPELEIYADDVKCAHGATCGQLDEMAVYYLRSRGLDYETARNLLMFTFAHTVLGKVAAEDARREMERRLVACLPGGAALEDLA